MDKGFIGKTGMPQKERIYYYPGFKPEYAFPGLIVLIIGITLCLDYSWWPLGALMILVSLVLIASMQGIEINYAEKKLVKYTDLLGIRISSVTDLNAYDMVSIVFEKETVSANASYDNDGWHAPVISFEMYLYGFTRKKTFLCEFGSHAEARRLADKMEKYLDFKIEDTIVDAIKLNRKKWWRRR